METPFTIRDQSCPNEACGFYQLKNQGNIVIHGKRPPRIKCTKCGKTWVAYRNEFHYGLRSDNRRIFAALKLLEQGMSVRKIASHVHVSPTTVQRWKSKASV